MKKVIGVCTILALIAGVVFSDDVQSIVEQNADSEAAQAVESVIEDSQPTQEALPEEEAQPEQADVQTPQPEESSQTQSVKTPYILGIITSPIPPMVRAQVSLPEETGLFVQTIKPNGPAAKAGILPYDIIVSIDGVAISNTNVLSAEIQKAAGKPQKLTILRYGKQLTVDITAQPADASRHPLGFLPGNPAQAPQFFTDPLAPNYDPNEDDDDINPANPRIQHFMDFQRRQMEIMRRRVEAMENAMRQGMPGFMPFVPAPFPGPATAPVPNGNLTLPPTQAPANDPNVQTKMDTFSVQVQKNGNDPAIIKIQENGNEYTVDENSIDQLPENIRNRLNFKVQTNDK